MVGECVGWGVLAWRKMITAVTEAARRIYKTNDPPQNYPLLNLG